MKSSGIEWIGNIPDDWEVKKLKYVAELDPTISEFLGDNDIVSFAPMECLGEQTLSPYETEYGKVKGKYTYFANEDIIMAKVTPCFENGNIAIAKNLKNNVGFGSSELFVFRAKNISNSFLMYSLYSEPFKSLAKSTMYGTGGLKRVSPEFILNYKIPFPPLKTQEKIADYLDEKCGEIDATITKQKESIEKLKAYKQSLISETVTKGLDKSAPLKPSGIEWIGDIPYDWEIRKVKNTGKLIGGSGFPEEYQGVKDEKIPFIKVKSLAEDPISRNGKDSISESIRSKLNAEKFIKGSVVFAKVGAALLLQRFRILEFDSCIDNNMMGFIPLVIEPRFFKYVTILFDFSYFVNPGTVPSINQEQIGNIKIPFPPLKSQEKIADYLDSKCSQIDKYITEKQNIIQKLDAYKKSLIFECVTGKRLV